MWSKIMAKIPIEFIADINSLQNVIKAFGTATKAFTFSEIVPNISRLQLEKALKIGPNTAAAVRNVRVEFDKYNNTIRQFGQAVLRIPTGAFKAGKPLFGDVPIGNIKQTKSTYEGYLKALESLADAQENFTNVQQRARVTQAQLNQDYKDQQRILFEQSKSKASLYDNRLSSAREELE